MNGRVLLRRTNRRSSRKVMLTVRHGDGFGISEKGLKILKVKSDLKNLTDQCGSTYNPGHMA